MRAGGPRWSRGSHGSLAGRSTSRQRISLWFSCCFGHLQRVGGIYFGPTRRLVTSPSPHGSAGLGGGAELMLCAGFKAELQARGCREERRARASPQTGAGVSLPSPSCTAGIPIPFFCSSVCSLSVNPWQCRCLPDRQSPALWRGSREHPGALLCFSLSLRAGVSPAAVVRLCPSPG